MKKSSSMQGADRNCRSLLLTNLTCWSGRSIRSSGPEEGFIDAKSCRADAAETDDDDFIVVSAHFAGLGRMGLNGPGLDGDLYVTRFTWHYLASSQKAPKISTTHRS